MLGSKDSWGFTVSEGGLEPPCPFGALAPQASASAYSATRTSACHGWCRASRITIANPGGCGDGAWRGHEGRPTAGAAELPRATTCADCGHGRERAGRLRVRRWPHHAEPSYRPDDRTRADRPG